MFVALFVILTAMPPVSANELDGFRGMYWGESLRAFKYMKFVAQLDGIKYYRKLNDELFVGGAGLTDINYAFFKDRLVGVVMLANGKENARLMLEALKYSFGTPSVLDEGVYSWDFVKIKILYRYDPYSKNLRVSYLSGETLVKMRRDKHL
ncbi:hypothetical protein FACS1894167_12420 [Synergistales bacterium]|nr:hypothetical protein FACS1894167_12420 [Synergistales bacterium]